MDGHVIGLDEIEEAIICKIKSAGGLKYLRSVESYGGELDDDGLNAVIRAYPAVWVVFGGAGKPKKVSAEKYKTPGKFVTMVAARNVRDEESTRHGNKKEVGTYQILSDVSALLINNDLGLPITRLQPGPIRTLFNTKIRGNGVSVLAREWSTQWTEKTPTEAEHDLLMVGLNYYLEPDDDEVDASDQVTLGED